MRIISRKVLVVALSVFLVYSSLGVVSANEPITPTADMDITAEVVGGLFGFAALPAVNIGSITLNHTEGSAVNVNTTHNIQAIDSRGQGRGWNASVSGTDLTATVADASAGSGATVTATIPVNSVRVLVGGAITTMFGQAVSPTHGPKSDHKTVQDSVYLSTTPQVLFYADPGFGMGRFSVPLTFDTLFPYTTTISSVSSPATSNFTVGSQVGLFAGTYSTKLTFTMTTGI